MIYVDSNVPMYLVGADHPNKQRVIELVPQLLTAREQLVTSAETFQEILHRYRGLGDREHLSAAYEALETMVSQTVDITKEDVDEARAMSGRYPELSSRDCLHIAAMHRLRCTTIWSYDRGFDVVSAIQRIE
ncbi:MAG: type II toxin-antitoxin system VapC family toxin [Chloroflexi bacterium]|nr:type II toxin-antitoxin system VapC family toxin [Chloroflexota bacterium]MDA1145369.1 type II toxin-antitoxin system VapC family toxin [Chloroflexota bacterium]